MKHFSLSPSEVADCLWRNRELVLALTKREIIGRYQGSVFGLLWSFFNPVFMLAIYTFVFSVVFKARWGVGAVESKAEFALVLFAGILVFNLFSESVNRAPALIVANPTYVKKVVFPLEILPWVNFGAALFHTAISLLVWLLFSLAVFGLPPLTALLLPLLLLPLALLTMGLSWFVASLGVFLRDVSQVISILTSALMFLTPIFYPVTAIPPLYRQLLYLNPLTFIVEQARDLLIFGKGMAWGQWGGLTLIAAGMAWFGFAWFQKTRKGFADVL